jgi:hypothetical protein
MSKLSKLLHGAGHLIWIGAQYANYASGVVPVKYQPIVASVLGVIQAVHGYYVGKGANHA